MARENNEIVLEDIVTSLESSIVVPTRPSMGLSYIETDIRGKVKEFPEIEISVDITDVEVQEPVQVNVIFELGEEISEREFTVSSILYEKLRLLDEMYYVVRDGNDSVESIEQYFTNVFDGNDVRENNIVVSLDNDTNTLSVGYSDLVLKELNIIKVDFDKEEEHHPMITEEFDPLLIQLIKDSDVSINDQETTNVLVHQLMDDNGVSGVNILQYIYTREFVIIPVSYRYRGDNLTYRFIIAKVSIDGILDYDDDGSDSGLYPPGAEQTPNSRFAISAISRNRAVSAYKQEIIVEKDIGEFLVKDRNSNVVSYDKLTRQKSFERQTISDAKLRGLFGDILRLDFDNMTLPGTVLSSQNIMTPLTVYGGPVIPNKVSMSVDLDTILLGVDSKLASEHTNASIIITIIGEWGHEEIRLTESVNNIITVDLGRYIEENLSLVREEDVYEVRLDSIKFEVDEKYNNRNVRLVLSDVLLIIEKPE